MDWNKAVSRKELTLIGIVLLLLAWLADDGALRQLTTKLRSKLGDWLKPEDS